MQFSSFEQSIFSNLERLTPGIEHKSYLLAISGGVDSMVLTHLFHKFNLNIEIAHCNFCLRGNESDQDEYLVHKVADEMGIPFHIKRFEQLKEKTKGNSIQLLAREYRYQWFEELLLERKLDHLVLAHHADDNLETAIYQLAKGTGIKGMKGMPGVNNTILRPLLKTEKAEIIEYASKEGIAFRNDSSNESTKYNRNLIRIKVIPELQKINPQISKTYSNHVELFTDAQSLIEQATELFKEKHTRLKHHSLTIDLDAIQKRPGKLNILLNLLEPYDFSFAQVKSILNKESMLSGKKMQTQTHELIYNRNELIISPLASPAYQKMVSTVPICVITPYGSLVFEKQQYIDIQQNNPNILYLESEKLLPFTIRTREKADIFYPAGMQGKKQKLKEYFVNNKYSIPEKDRQLLLISDEKICWIIGKRADERFIQREITEQSIKISWLPE